MRNALNKDFIRDILKSKGRFISIVAIVALGVAFFTGIKSAPLVMQKSSDKYYDDYNLMDIRLLSTLGLTDEDVAEIKKIDNVDGVFPTYSMDVLSEYNASEIVLKVHSLDISNTNNNNKNYINQLKVIKGRLPEKSGECVVEQSKVKSIDYPIGSKIKLSSGNDDKLTNSLKETEYTVVGYVQTPYYLSQEKGNSSIGSGVVSGAIMIPQDDFKIEAFTEVFLTVKGAKALDTYSDEYFDLVESVTDEIEGIKDIRSDERYNEVLKEANDKLKEAEDKLQDGKVDLEKGKKEYEANKIKAQKELKDAQNKINNYSKQIEDGEKQLKSEKLEVESQIKDGENKIKVAEERIKSGEIQYEKALADFNSKKELAQVELQKAESQLKEINTQINNLKDSNKLIEEQLKNESLSSEERDNLQGTLGQNKYLLSMLELSLIHI